MGTSIAIKYQSHLGLSILTDRLPRRLQSILAVLANLLGAGVAVMLIKLGWEMIQTQIRLGSITATLQWPAWIYSMAIPVGGVFMLIRFVQAAVCKALDKEVL